MMEPVTIKYSEDSATDMLVQKLAMVRTGLQLLGTHAPIIDEAIRKLKEQDAMLQLYRDQTPYQAGHKDGYEAAFATGQTGNQGK
ncbi:hypothetical protein KX928_23170 [Roseobacter sp. YSTF-M11]|uniref:Uncharacterized protein n=1 Tax=Roseobacter insulae TaxID=2859783 RepID=A0A9X1K0L9_9RHOB|nr:hypothetical protein [Roseobacter insulae]MBW4710701.1 hypothetical protein [Roseobacter insulae]